MEYSYDTIHMYKCTNPGMNRYKNAEPYSCMASKPINIQWIRTGS